MYLYLFDKRVSTAKGLSMQMPEQSLLNASHVRQMSGSLGLLFNTMPAKFSQLSCSCQATEN